MKERAGSVAEISVFPTGISESGLKVAMWTEKKFISVTEPARLTGIMWRGPNYENRRIIAVAICQSAGKGLNKLPDAWQSDILYV